nr:NADH dehydrogenase subunit 3 [Fulicoffula longipila]
MPKVLMMWGLLIALICSLMLFISFMFSLSTVNMKSNTPFECGMEPIRENHPPFYMNFYMVAILFLIFDVEFVITIPLLFTSMSYLLWLMFWLAFFVILMVGLVLEVNLGSLDWKE